MELRNNESNNNARLDTKHQMTFVFTMVGIILLALVSATYAWFTLSATNELDMLEVNAHAGSKMRFDVFNHGTDIDAYVQNVDGARINKALEGKGQPTLDELSLFPITSNDGMKFYKRDANENNGSPIKFERGDGILAVDFYFIAEEDMYVHLSPLTEDNQPGTKIKPADDRKESEEALKCLRLSFVSEALEVAIYEPSGQDDTKIVGQAAQDEASKRFTLPEPDEFEYNNDNKLFFLEAGKVKKVTMYVWIEGEDPDCNDAALDGSVEIGLRFVGTDENNKVLR